MAEVQQLLYIGDPMCSWCYGFAGEMQRVIDKSGLPVQVITGGLRAYGTEIVEGRFRDFIAHHWQEVEKRSGAPFAPGLAETFTGLVYDTEPACRAVVTARLLAPGVSPWPVFRAIQHAFYAEGRDVTKPDVLSAIVAECTHIDSADIGTMLVSDGARTTTQHDFELCQRLGVRGFPTLLLQDGESFELLTNGYSKAETILEAMGLSA